MGEIVSRVRAKAPQNHFCLALSRLVHVRELWRTPGSLAHARTDDGRVRITLVSLAEATPLQRKCLEAESPAPFAFDEPMRRTVYGHAKDDGDDALGRFTGALRVALCEGDVALPAQGSARGQRAQIVCVNELGFPTLDHRPHVGAATFVRAQADDHRALVVAGTSHDRVSRFNVAHIFIPGHGSEAPLGAHYVKQTSASWLDPAELVDTPPRRLGAWVQVYRLRVAVLTCSDLLDFNAVASLVRAPERIHVLLVPCYSEGFKALDAVAGDVSSAIGGYVFLVNRMKSGQTEWRRRAYLVGRKIEDDDAGWEPEVVLDQGHVALRTFAFDVQAFRERNRDDVDLARLRREGIAQVFGLDDPTPRSP